MFVSLRGGVSGRVSTSVIIDYGQDIFLFWDCYWVFTCYYSVLLSVSQVQPEERFFSTKCKLYMYLTRSIVVK